MGPDKKKIKPKAMPQTNSTFSVEQRDEIERVQKSETSEPDQIHAQVELCEERADSLSIEKNQNQERTDSLTPKQPIKQRLKSKHSERREQSVEVQLCSEVDSVSNLAHEQLDEERIQPKSEEVEQSINIQESQKVEPTRKLSRSQPNLQKLKSISTDESKQSVEIQSNSNIENTNEFTSEKSLTETIKPKSLKPEEIELSVQVQENVDVESTSKLAEKQPKVKKGMSKQSDAKERSVAVDSHPKMESTSTLETKRPGEKKAKLSAAKEGSNILTIKNVDQSEGAASLVDETLKETIIVLPSLNPAEDISLEANVKGDIEIHKYLVEEPDTPSVEVNQPTFVKNEPLVSIANVEDVEIKDSSFVSLDTHDNSDTLKEQQTYPSSSEVYIFSFYYLYFPFQNNFTYTRNL